MGKTQRLLTEQNKVLGTAQNARIRLLSAGQGSSGFYPAEMIEQYGPTAFPAGTQVFNDHLTESEEWERRGQHSIKDLVGVTTSAPVYNAEEQSLEADVKFFPNAADFVREAYEHFELSIEAMSYTNDDGVVEALIPSPFNAVALVPKGGRDGKITALVESYREKHGNIVTNREHAVDERKETGVEPKDITAIATAVAEALAPSFTQITEALKPAEVVEVEKTDAPEASEVAEALIEAGLTKTARARVFEAVKGGEDVAKAIEAEKALREEILTESATNEEPGAVETATKVTESLLSATKVEFK